MKARQKRPGRAQPPPPRKQEKSEEPAQYELLLERYLHDPQFNKMRAALATYREDLGEDPDERRKDLAGYPRRSAALAASEAAVLEDLRARARQRGGRLLRGEEGMVDFEAVTNAVVPTSDASARIFGALIRENLIDADAVLGSLRRRAGMLSSGWIAVVEEVGRTAKPDSDDWRSAMYFLCWTDAPQEQYRPVLERLAREKADSYALHALFFKPDWQTGELQAVNTHENRALMRELAGSPNPAIRLNCGRLAADVGDRALAESICRGLSDDPDPGVRAACARLAAEAGDLALAESICTKLLATRYKGSDSPDGPTPEEDRPLYAARLTALQVLFYQVHDERAFKLVYDESLLPWSQFPRELEPKPDPKGWVRADAYVLMSMEIDQARALISMVEDREER